MTAATPTPPSLALKLCALHCAAYVQAATPTHLYSSTQLFTGRLTHSPHANHHTLLLPVQIHTSESTAKQQIHTSESVLSCNTHSCTLSPSATRLRHTQSCQVNCCSSLGLFQPLALCDHHVAVDLVTLLPGRPVLCSHTTLKARLDLWTFDNTVRGGCATPQCQEVRRCCSRAIVSALIRPYVARFWVSPDPVVV